MYAFDELRYLHFRRNFGMFPEIIFFHAFVPSTPQVFFNPAIFVSNFVSSSSSSPILLFLSLFLSSPHLLLHRYFYVLIFSTCYCYQISISPRHLYFHPRSSNHSHRWVSEKKTYSYFMFFCSSVCVYVFIYFVKSNFF